jgi:steroid delta-isomerase-like uncharacterized protein
MPIGLRAFHQAPSSVQKGEPVIAWVLNVDIVGKGKIMNTIQTWTLRPTFLVAIAIVVSMLFASHLVPVARGGAMSPPGFETGGSGIGSSNEVAVARLFNDVFSGKNGAACVDLVAEDAVVYTPNGTYTGHVGMRNFVDALRASFPNASFNVTDLMSESDTVVASWVMTGTHDGAFQGIAATGAPVTLDGITILRFEHGMIVEEWIAYDRLHLVQQIEADANRQNPPSGVCPPCLEP